MSFYRRYGKRAWDVALSGVSIVLLSPLFVLLWLLIRLDSKGPVLFRQARVGKDKTRFAILKYRTMRVGAPRDVPTHRLKTPSQYLTRMGRFLRHASLDELPQLFNVFRGDMSLVGPRPALWNQDDLIALRDENGANGVLPGLTGFAQINGRDELPIPEKARLDGVYAQKLSFAFDLQILLRTVGSVLRADGVQEGGTGTTEKGKQ